jgi:hypothetical protein
MQETELLPSLLQNNEDGVHEIKDLGQIEHVQDESDRRLLVVEVVARHEGVSSIVSAYPGLNTHVGAQHHLDNVVNELQRIQKWYRRQLLHNNSADQDKREVAQCDGEGGLEVRERPVLHQQNQLKPQNK